MPDRTQEIKNLRAVAVASKNYIDKRIDDLEWQIGTYNYDVDTDSNVARNKTLPSDTYKSMVDYIGGKSVKYNQLVRNGNFESASGWSANGALGTGVIANNKLTYTIEVKAVSQSIYTASGYRSDIVSGHKYLVCATITTSQNASASVELDGATSITTFGSLTANTKTQLKVILTATNSTTNKALYIYPNYSGGGLEVGATAIFEQIEIIDLTDRFGAGNEPSTVETAIPLLKANGYKLDGTDTYSTGDLKHAVVSGVKYEGFNLFDYNTWINAPVYYEQTYAVRNYQLKPNTTYSVFLKELKNNATVGVYLLQPDSSLPINTTGFIGLTSNYMYQPMTFTTNSTGVVKIGYVTGDGTYLQNNLILNLGSTSQPYTPYVAPITKAIPSQVLADSRYGLGFDNTNYNHLDSDGHLRGNYAIVDLGTLDYTYSQYLGSDVFISNTTIANVNVDGANTKAICEKYLFDWNMFNSSVIASLDDIFAISYSGNLYIKDATYNDAQDFKNAMSGVYLIYELNDSFDIDLSQYFTDGWNKVDLDNLYASCEMVCDEPIDMPNSITNLIKEVKA